MVLESGGTACINKHPKTGPWTSELVVSVKHKSCRCQYTEVLQLSQLNPNSERVMGEPPVLGYHAWRNNCHQQLHDQLVIPQSEALSHLSLVETRHIKKPRSSLQAFAYQCVAYQCTRERGALIQHLASVSPSNLRLSVETQRANS